MCGQSLVLIHLVCQEKYEAPIIHTFMKIGWVIKMVDPVVAQDRWSRVNRPSWPVGNTAAVVGRWYMVLVVVGSSRRSEETKEIKRSNARTAGYTHTTKESVCVCVCVCVREREKERTRERERVSKQRCRSVDCWR